MSDLADWLLEQIAADEKLARKAHEENPQATWTGHRRYDGAWSMDLHSEHPDSDSHGVGDDLLMPREMAKHISRWDPARVLAECTAKRRLVVSLASAHHASEVWLTGGRDQILQITDEALRLLAQPYRDRDGYRLEWDVQ